MNKPIADYEGPRHAVNKLLQAECDRRILLLRGPAGTGKSRLLEYCRDHRPATVRLVPVDLKGTELGVSEIFSRFGFALTVAALTRFTARIAVLEAKGETPVVIEQNWQVGFKNRINVVLHTGDAASRQERRTDLTDALFDDLAVFDSPVIILFDTYEEAPSEVKDWLKGPFLARAAQTDAVRVVIAGKDVPKSTIDWGHCCDLHDLQGVHDPVHWLPVIKELQRRVPKLPEETFLAGLCHALEGNPLLIMGMIEAFERETPAA